MGPAGLGGSEGSRQCFHVGGSWATPEGARLAAAHVGGGVAGCRLRPCRCDSLSNRLPSHLLTPQKNFKRRICSRTLNLT